MGELMPAVEAEVIRQSLTDYLTTTFALTDEATNFALTEFLTDPERGIFKGPFVRTNLPFQAATAETSPLNWVNTYQRATGWRPYGHQAAAFSRLASIRDGEETRPLPTMVTTGTGSGKTEAFLYPILDHVLRAQRAGKPGIKALILYPMNALANDQAQRLAGLLTSRHELRGIRAGVYTGQHTTPRRVVTAEGLINDRHALREDPPDILLTNYKMLDQLLLRAEDQTLWRVSADSLQYLVLDEFHTYDGAQGTDVAMLLRRLGLALSHYGDQRLLTAEDRQRPLGRVTPVATSATLGGENHERMRHFAETVFGEPFTEDAVIGETRLTLQQWTEGATAELARMGLEPKPLGDVDAHAYAAALESRGDRPDARELLAFTVPQLVRPLGGAELDPAAAEKLATDPKALETVMRASNTAVALLDETSTATPLGELPERFLPPAATRGRAWRHRRLQWEAFFRGVISSLGHVRARRGRQFPSVEVHYWLRELSRVERSAEVSSGFSWSDDGAADVEAADSQSRPRFPAVYCRRCGRSGWQVSLAPVGEQQSLNDGNIRRDSARNRGRNRSLIYAPGEGEAALRGDEPVMGLRWWNVRGRDFTADTPDPDHDDYRAGWVLPVLTNMGADADQENHEDTCPACGTRDSVRFLGSAIATLLSVSLSTLFSAQGLAQQEKRALVFADSVQDAAHRAGFIQARTHTMTLRAIFAEALGDREMSLDQLADAVVDAAGDDPIRRYRMLPPDVAEWDTFRTFWVPAGATAAAKRRARGRVLTRLLFDTQLEFGAFSQLGRTLEMTGTVSAHVEAGEPELLDRLAHRAIKKAGWQDTLLEVPEEEMRVRRVQWARGVLEHVRRQGGIDHPWLTQYQVEGGKRFHIWGGRKRSEGMPAFPTGRTAPTFPLVGGAGTRGELDAVLQPNSWYSQWTGRALNLPGRAGGRLAGALLDTFAAEGTLHGQHASQGGTVYSLRPSSVILRPVTLADMQAGNVMLECSVCSALVPGSVETTAALDGAPCLAAKCSGSLARKEVSEGFYRRMYRGAAMRRLVAREHTSLLEDKTRVAYEDQFKEATDNPSSPNVLVATPTLEMGIDIGDLSAVYLSSLPRTVASYTQRVGRAGRLNGNTLAVTYARGRGKDLPRTLSPLSVIEGEVAPPATYLDAEEILRRQFTAAILDSFARSPDRPHPKRAPEVFASVAEPSLLGQAIVAAEEKGGIYKRFRAAFKGVGEVSLAMLDAWITPVEGPGSSRFAAEMAEASARWNQEVETLSYRIEELRREQEELAAKVQSPAVSSEDEKAFRAVQASLRLARGRRSTLQGEFWVSVLEEYGLLPNYTLLDDVTTLGVGVSQRDPETGERDAVNVEVSRPSALALREFAPGAKFYTSGLEIEIDAVDLGMDAESVRKWALCDRCGYGVDLVETVGELPSQCPRCGSVGIADVGQQLDLVEFRRATAEVSRDEATISDRDDNRRRPYFEEITAVDLDPGRCELQWGEKTSGLGCAYFSRLTVRHLNLGTAGRGSELAVADIRKTPGLFNVCEGCGKLQNAGQTTSWRHRPWCPHRKDLEPHDRKIALSHTVSTQGLVLYFPPEVTMADSFAVVSLMAALAVGLRDVLGADPDHLSVLPASVPDPQGNGVREALVLHDRIPGGTGYLTDWAQPQQLHRVLTAAWRVVVGCECQTTDQLACDQCLLPYVSEAQVPNLSRAAAQKHLETLLGLAGDDVTERPDFARWDIRSGHVPQVEAGESVLEHRFRKVLQRRLESVGARVTERIDQGNLTLTILPPDTAAGGQGRRWSLKSQVTLGGTRPDFLLESTDMNVPKVAIYTDGWAYHASEANNRLADDALKRQQLRDGAAGFPVQVLAVTMRDVEQAERGVREEAFLAPTVRERLQENSSFASTPNAFDRQGSNPVDWVTEWIQDPAVEDIRKAARGAPLFISGKRAQPRPVRPGEGLAAAVANAVVGGRPPADADPSQKPLVWVQGGVGVGIRQRPGTDALDAAVVIDDRAGQIASPEAWRQWLRISNAFILRDEETTITTTTLALETSGAALKPVSGDGAEKPTVPMRLSTEWAALVEQGIDDTEKELLTVLAHGGVSSFPAVGEEGPGGIPIDIGWPKAKVALATPHLTEAEREELTGAGWVLVDSKTEGLTQRLRNVGIR